MATALSLLLWYLLMALLIVLPCNHAFRKRNGRPYTPKEAALFLLWPFALAIVGLLALRATYKRWRTADPYDGTQIE